MAYLIKLREVGNGWVLTLPRALCRELSWPPGTYLVVRAQPNDTVTIRRLEAPYGDPGPRHHRDTD